MSDLPSRAASAYASSVKATVDPRRLEASVLSRAAQRLEAVRCDWDGEGRDGLDAALLYNRKLWTVLAAEMADDGNPLPLPIRNNIANLAVFVFKRTFEAQAAPDPDKLQVLIQINTQLAGGLLSAVTRPRDIDEPAPSTMQAVVNA